MIGIQCKGAEEHEQEKAEAGARNPESDKEKRPKKSKYVDKKCTINGNASKRGRDIARFLCFAMTHILESKRGRDIARVLCFAMIHILELQIYGSV